MDNKHVNAFKKKKIENANHIELRNLNMHLKKII